MHIVQCSSADMLMKGVSKVMGDELINLLLHFHCPVGSQARGGGTRCYLTAADKIRPHVYMLNHLN